MSRPGREGEREREEEDEGIRCDEMSVISVISRFGRHFKLDQMMIYKQSRGP